MKKVIAKINGKRITIITDCESRFFIIDGVYCYCDYEISQHDYNNSTNDFDAICKKISRNKKYDLNDREKEMSRYMWEVYMG